MDWFLYDRDLRHERVKLLIVSNNETNNNISLSSLDIFLSFNKFLEQFH